jgi:hypothetical protein
MPVAMALKLGGLIRFVARDFLDFVLHQKKWWVTALILTLAVFVGFVLMNEPRGVRPLIYNFEF